MFFSFDGLDGAGKTTQLKLLADWLRAQGHEVVTCYDPGCTPLGEEIRGLVLGEKQLAIGPAAEMLLFMAARAELVDEVIAPALTEGKTVVSDRYVLANLVYQGYAGGLDIETVRHAGLFATRGILPDLTFVLDLPPEAASGRITRHLDRMERRGADYQTRLRAGFLTEAAREPDKIVVIDASRAIDAVQADIREHARRVLG